MPLGPAAFRGVMDRKPRVFIATPPLRVKKRLDMRARLVECLPIQLMAGVEDDARESISQFRPQRGVPILRDSGVAITGDEQHSTRKRPERTWEVQTHVIKQATHRLGIDAEFQSALYGPL